jgi:hypothetical protein
MGDEMTGIGSHQSQRALTIEWLTPPEILAALGPFDLDPCAPVKRPWDMAKQHYTIQDNGLLKAWHGRVWLNPPYGAETGKWLARLADHNNGIALIFARTETKMFFSYVWGKATGLLFIEGRLFFHRPDGERADFSSGGPSVLIAYGQHNAIALQTCGIKGAFVYGWRIR